MGLADGGGCGGGGRYGGDVGDNSKWYGTRRYHGLERDPEPLDADEAPSGSF